jgi:hypothetical protein
MRLVQGDRQYFLSSSTGQSITVPWNCCWRIARASRSTRLPLPVSPAEKYDRTTPFSFVATRRYPLYQPSSRRTAPAVSGDVLRLMLGQAGLLLVVGLGIGCALALAIGRTAGTLLFGLQPNDPLSFAISVLALGIVALAAAYLPAARATRMSPLDGLRAD